MLVPEIYFKISEISFSIDFLLLLGRDWELNPAGVGFTV